MSKSFDAFDATAVIAHLPQIKAAGYMSVGLYYFKSSKFKRLLTRSVAEAVSKAGLYLISVYENGFPTAKGYFTVANGQADAHVAHTRAVDAGQPIGSAIYFAVDYDAAPADLPAITDYFTEIRRVFQVLGDTHFIGVYGSGLVCRHLSEAGLVSRTWLSQSKGFAGYDDWKIHANILQGPVASLFGGIDVDLDTTNGNAGGWRLPTN